MKKSHFRLLKNKWVVTGLVIAVIIVLIVWAKSSGSAPVFESAKASMGDITEIVGVTGTISPIDKADLSFKKGGVVSRIYVKVGDKVTRGQMIASLDSGADSAALASAEATLADTSRELRPEELAVSKSTLDSAEEDARNTAHDALAKAQSAIFNYADTFFSNPQSSNPNILLRTDSVPVQTAINEKRLEVSAILNSWSASLVAGDSSETNPLNMLTKVRSSLSKIKDFMTSLSVIVNSQNPGNSSLSQATINTNVSTMNTGLTTLNTTIDSVSASMAALSAAQTSFNLKIAGNSSESIAAQSARVAQARAVLYDASIVSPIDGVVTKADPNVGEYMAPGQSGFAVQNNDFKIEAYVPEADIAKVAVGNIASSTLDAYGSGVDFPAKVIMIDPAETVLEGVPTYKVTLQFLTPDTRVRSGMTANLEIHTNQRHNVLTIPYRAVVDTDGAKTARVVNPDKKSWKSVPITVGLKGSTATIEVLSGLNVGDLVVTYVK